MKRNKIWKNGTIRWYRAAAIDGAELFESTKKSCPDYLIRRHGKEGTEYFYRSVVCMTVGEPPHIILGQKMPQYFVYLEFVPRNIVLPFSIKGLFQWSHYYREGYNLFLWLRKDKENELLFLHGKRVPAICFRWHIQD